MLATNTRCDVIDQIIPWTDQDGNLNIGVGDLVLQNGHFEQVSAIRAAAVIQKVFLRYECSFELHSKPMDGLVAVRRYVVTEPAP